MLSRTRADVFFIGNSLKTNCLSLLLALTFYCFIVPGEFSVAHEYKITPESKLDPICKKAKAGDSIILADGIWKDVKFKFDRLPGTDADPIRILPQTTGGVTLTGKTDFRVSGTHVIISGLVFRDCHSVDDVFQLRSHEERPAENCRVTDCVFEETSDLQKSKEESRWLSIHGTNNRVDHCYFAGKKNKGTTLVVWVTQEPGRHQIDHNYFGARPELKENGGETIRVGTSDVSELVSATIVEDNFFHRCDGEAEVISNKSCENIYRRNMFEQCSGALTLRHGHRCTVDGNAFLGQGGNGTGGVRIIGQGHVVTNNYFEGLRGSSARASISWMNGIPNSPLDEYAPVRDALVAHNTFVDCKVTMEFGVGASKKQSVAPADSKILNNLFLPGKWPLFKFKVEPKDFQLEGNLLQSQSNDNRPVNFERRELKLRRADDGLMRPTRSSPLRVKVKSPVKTDIDGQPRSRTTMAGCDQPKGSQITWPSRKNCGPTWVQK